MSGPHQHFCVSSTARQRLLSARAAETGPRARRRSFGEAHCPEASVPTFQSTLHRLKKPVSRFKPQACLACANPQPAAIQPIRPQPHVASSAATTISSIRKPWPAP